MRKAKMATHTISAFNEGDAIRLLSDVLESKRKIKTFFKENDRTPNYDGSFEIINDDGTPKKQFIVQIKKVENLTPNIQGKNKGKYVYSLDTAFLYYVKEKVTESPAIYFVVDIELKNIFWIYLSDETLMSMDFEEKGEKLSYPFSEEDKLIDIDSFTNKLINISVERNSLFIYKTEDEIAEIQDAIEYLNNYMNNDFINIKKSMFPNLWRFGLRYSRTSNVSIKIDGSNANLENVAMFALYPQVKGGKDIGIQKYAGLGGDNLFDNFDLTGTSSPMDYSKNSLKKIIETFFEQEYSFLFFPTIALEEKLSIFATEISKIFIITDDNNNIVVDKLFNGFCWLMKYVETIILNTPRYKEEFEYSQLIATSIRLQGFNSCDLISMCLQSKCEKHFQDFYELNTIVEEPRFNMNILNFIKREHIRYILMTLELESRKIELLNIVWDYDYSILRTLSDEKFIRKIDEICEKWFSILPELYNTTFEKIFDKNKYKFNGKFVFKNEILDSNLMKHSFSSIIRKYDNDNLLIIYDPSINREYTDKEEGLISVSYGYLLDSFLKRKTLIYDSLNCLLYKGICKGLGIEAKQLSFGHDSLSLF